MIYHGMECVVQRAVDQSYRWPYTLPQHFMWQSCAWSSRLEVQAFHWGRVAIVIFLIGPNMFWNSSAIFGIVENAPPGALFLLVPHPEVAMVSLISSLSVLAASLNILLVAAMAATCWLSL